MTSSTGHRSPQCRRSNATVPDYMGGEMTVLCTGRSGVVAPMQGAEVEGAHLTDRGSELRRAASAARGNPVLEHLRLRTVQRVIT